MSQNSVDVIKSSKPFRLLDAAVYAAILLVAVALLIVFVFLPKPESLTSSGAVIAVTVRGEEVLTFDFGGGGLAVIRAEMCEAGDMSDGKQTVTVRTGGDGYNIILFDLANGGRVSVQNANCSLRHDCTLTELTSSESVIICIPHQLKISVKNSITDPISG